MENRKPKRKNLVFFFLIAFGFSWVFWLPKIIIAQGLPFPGPLADFINSPYNPAAFGPFVAALIVVFREKGIKGVKGLLKRGIDLSFKKKWLIPILLLMPVITLFSIVAAKALNDAYMNFMIFKELWMIPYWFFYLLLFGGPLQEEFGWRGYALDKLQKKYSAFTASIILGILWALWHLPLHFASGAEGPQYTQITSILIGSFVTVSLLSIIFTWIYNNTEKSILAVLLLHASLNFSTFKLFPIFEVAEAVPYYTLIIFIFVLAITTVYGRKTLVRKNTG